MAANVTLPDELLERAKARATDEGKSVDDLAAEAVSRLLAERNLAKFRREAERRSGGKSDDQVNDIVNEAIRETRNEARGR
jgi:post-segregation antitoxin (ccd killing protein)